MQELASSLIFSPSDLNHFVECEHLTSLDVLAVAGQGIAKAQDPQAMLLRARGIEHEQAWLARLRDSGQSIITIAGEERVDWTRDAARTEQAMRDGADVIYQGVFVSEPWRGIADFLVRVATPSALWPWSYEAWDTKLGRHPKPYFILQLCWYSEQLARVQGTEPAWMHVVLGTNEVVPFALRDFAAYYRAVRNRFLRMVDEKRETYPYPVPTAGCAGIRTPATSAGDMTII